MPYFMILRLGPAITLCCVFEVRPPPPRPGGSHARRTPFPLPVEASPFSQLITHHDADAPGPGRAAAPGCRAAVHGRPCGSGWLRNLCC